MFKKTYASVYFSQDSISVIELSGNKTKVERSQEIPLPSEIYSNGNIKDADKLSQIVKAAWQKIGIKVRTVGIVVPEKLTFTKLINVPKVGTADLNEAVRWQAEDVFPTDPEKLLLDWRICGRNEKEYEILVATIDRQVLEKYVEVFEKAGLFPTLVASPSISLNNLISDEDCELFIYKSKGESLIMLTKGKRIYISSILLNPESATIAKTAQRIFTHFKNIKIDKVLISGDSVVQKDIDLVKKTLGVEVYTYKKDIKGFKNGESQTFLIPLSLQYHDVAEPSDFETINLLPPDLVYKYNTAKLQVQIWSLTLTATLFTWTMFFLTLATYLFLSQQVSAKNTKSLSQSEITQSRKEVTENVNLINTTAAKVLAIKKLTITPQQIFNEIHLAKPEGITLTNYKIDFDKGLIELNGVSKDRSILITFKQELEKNKNLNSVQIPISTLEVEQDVVFQLTMEYIPLLTKKGAKK